MRERISCNERGIPYDAVDVALTARQLKAMATRYRDRYSDLIYRQADLRERKRINRARAAKRRASWWAGNRGQCPRVPPLAAGFAGVQL